MNHDRPEDEKQLDDLGEWLSKNKLHAYRQALEDFGYDDAESLSLMTSDEIDELSVAIEMRPGHQKKFKKKVEEMKEELKEQEAARKREKEETREADEDHKLKRKREKEEFEEDKQAERKREKAKREELAKIETERELRVAELASIKAERELAKARNTRDAEGLQRESATGSREKGKQREEEEEAEEQEAKHTEKESNVVPEDLPLPPNRKHHYFASHKKNHSINGNSTEMLARGTVDVLRATHKLLGFFDVDNLTSISMEALAAAIKESCVIVLFLDSETHKSTWVMHELETARNNNIGVITVIDTDKYNQREIIEKYFGFGLGYLFSEQCVGFSTEYRLVSYHKLAAAIKRAVEKPVASDSPQELPHADTKTGNNTPHSVDGPSLFNMFREKVIERFTTPKLAWQEFNSISKNEGLSRTDFKTALSMLGVAVSGSDKRNLRKALDPENKKVIQYKDFKSFIETGTSTESNEHSPGPALAALPIDVPSLPESFRHRESNENQLIALLTGRISSRSSCIAAQGMGGVGKSCIKSAVIRSHQIRQAFDTIVWIGLCQKPSISALQQHLYFQLTNEHMPKDKIGSADNQQECLVECAIGMSLLLVIDDCWDFEHFSMFNIIDQKTQSKVLVSTRISGLVKGSTEIKLALMSVKESVNLLATAAGLDDASLPPSLIEVARLCGRLPLCLNIAGSIIADHGEMWETELLPEMRSGMSQVIEDGSSLNGISVQDSIIVASLSSITGKDAVRIHHLFEQCGVWGEDQRIPWKVFAVLYAARPASSKETAPTLVTIKRWLSTLVKRSLLLELIRGSMQLHDIVRDYCLSKISDPDLKKLQGDFLQKLLQSKPSWEQLPQMSQKIPKGKELDWFVSGPGLQWHMTEALTKPLRSGDLACGWLVHPSDIIVAAAVMVIVTDKAGLEEIKTVAVQKCKGKQYAQAARMLFWASQGTFVSAACHTGKITADFTDLCNDALAALDCVTERDQASFDFEAALCHQIQIMTVSAMTTGKNFLRDNAIERLMRLNDKHALKDKQSLISVLMVIWATRSGYLSPVSKDDEDEENNAEHSLVWRKCVVLVAEHILETGTTELAKYGATVSVHTTLYWNPQSTWLTPLLPTEARFFHHDAYMVWHEDYKSEFNQRINEWPSVFRYNSFLYANPGAALLSLRCADLPSALKSAAVWEEHAVKAQQSNEHHMTWEYAGVFPILCQLLDLERCVRMFRLVGMSWHSAASMDLAPLGWAWNNELSCGNQEETVCLCARLLCVRSSPSSVEKSEVLAALPAPDSGADALRERVLGVACYIVPSCRTFTAGVARELGDQDFASAHSRAALVDYKNVSKWPFQVMFARASLATTLALDCE